MKRNVFMILLSVIFAFAVIGCENEGPAEKAGKKIDNAVIKAEKEVNDTIDTVKEKTEEAKK